MTNQTHTVVFQPSGLRGKVADGATILDASRKLGAGIESVCGGKGTCGKCQVKIEEGSFAKYGISSAIKSVKTIGEANQRFVNKRQLKQGYRLSCQTRICGDLVSLSRKNPVNGNK